MTSDIDEPLSDPLGREQQARVRVHHDPASLCELLARHCEDDPPHGYVLGKTALRDLLMERVGASAADAERTLDRLEAAGVLVYEGANANVDDQSAAWRVERGAITRVA